MTLANGSQAPDFELRNQFGEPIRLSDYRGRRSVALVFFPLAFSGICTGELGALQDNLGEFRDANIDVIGISVDSKFALRTWAEQQGFQFTLLSDFWPHGDVARAYGAFLEDRGVAKRATFVIDDQGVIRAGFVTAPGVARSIEAYREAVAQLRPV